jgi:hypothetical protein
MYKEPHAQRTTCTKDHMHKGPHAQVATRVTAFLTETVLQKQYN